MIYLLEEVLLGVGSYLSSFVHFALWSLSYMQLRIGPYEKELTDVPNDPKAQEDYPDAQEIQEDAPND